MSICSEFRFCDYTPFQGHVQHNLGNNVPSLLANHFFLLLEPNSGRSADALAFLKTNFAGNVKQKEGSTDITIFLSPDDNEWSSAEMMIGMMAASNTLEENKDKSEAQLFAENTESFFKILGELNDEQSGLWWDFYIPFFYDIAKSDHITVYCAYIAQVAMEDQQSWATENEEQLDAFFNWLNEE